MCLLWVLLQFVVLAAFWDVLPVGSEEEVMMMEMKREVGEEEEPLMGSDEEQLDAYRDVDSEEPGISTSTKAEPIHGNQNPFKNFSLSKGEPAGPPGCQLVFFVGFM